ncbi:MAG: sigma-54-dependent Fis family transcriptional regulator [Proteobacteria bacterium]|nr:sigma-54-dependent Fis family transcriptional regulator [Burkholderiales bacterium]
MPAGQVTSAAKPPSNGDAASAAESFALIVEDDRDAAQALAELVRNEGFRTAIAGSLAEARQQVVLRLPDLVLLDLMLPDGSGMELFDEREELGNVEIVLMTGHASLETSIQALRLGAADYLLKPVSPRQLKAVLNRIGRPAESRAEIVKLQQTADSEGRFGHMRGRAPVMQLVYTQIGRVAGTAVTVFIIGESGSGKEVVAQTIHDLSRRRKAPFLAVNCGAISPQLIESEMFGHEKGSFTGANRQHRGFFERANGGTLFLDEVTEMPLELQVKLLRVLESGTFMRVGSDDLLETDVRIVAATNRDPAQAVIAGKLREDLFYRLNVFQIRVPPLRDRLEDVPLLAQHFLDALNSREKGARKFAASALDKLGQYSWPGNVRELRNVVQRAYIMADGQSITAECIPFDAPQRSGQSITIAVGTTVEQMERQLILATLDSVKGHKERAAELLGISPKTLYNRLRDYGRDASEATDE